MYTITALARKFGLARSTLIYYDKKGVLKPSSRNIHNNYRLYTESDYEKLRQICTLRSVGIPLVKIKQIINSKKTDFSSLLTQRLFDLDDEARMIREQQRIIAELLGTKKLLTQTRVIDKKGWIALLKSSGLDDEGLNKWHQAFEKNAPKAHQDFLEYLGIDSNEIKKIRKASKK